ncbi:MAG: hypothetical protein ABIH66_05655 [bacterium]
MYSQVAGRALASDGCKTRGNHREKGGRAMNIADVLGVLVILAFTVAGYYIGSVRAFSILLGVILAFQITAPFIDRGMGQFVLMFIGVVAGVTIIGYLVYGATRFHLIDSMDGVFGCILGLCAGWGLARFIFHTYFLYLPEAHFTALISSSLVGMDIYYISPIQSILNTPAISDLRKPKI